MTTGTAPTWGYTKHAEDCLNCEEQVSAALRFNDIGEEPPEVLELECGHVWHRHALVQTMVSPDAGGPGLMELWNAIEAYSNASGAVAFNLSSPSYSDEADRNLRLAMAEKRKAVEKALEALRNGV